MTHEYYMQLALKEAQKAFESEEVPVGAVIVQGERIIARGFNQVEKLNDPTAHAEIIALTSAFNYLGSKYLPDAKIYITIEPCLMCAGALYWSKIGTVVYGATDDKNGYHKFCASHMPGPFHPRTELFNGIMSDECGLLMKEFFRARR
jgi:tRNA(adenine34) deaminase